ncbi:MAG: hypothetical protein IPO61_07485 [Gammaproteobacteria bacterium]|nr:hypothetical protein [Gammaproteobacteria bacterium]
MISVAALTAARTDSAPAPVAIEREAGVDRAGREGERSLMSGRLRVRERVNGRPIWISSKGWLRMLLIRSFNRGDL